MKVCDEALQFDPDDASSHFIKAVALYRLKRPEESIHEFRITIEKNPKHVLAHNNLAEVLRIKGSYDEALSNAARPWNSTPTCPKAIARWPIFSWRRTISRGDGTV